MAEPVTILGAGLAGCEAAWQLANRGIPVTLWEMKPDKMTPAHHSPLLGELVCSNSLRSDQLENAVGLLKEELRRLGSLILRCADAHRVEAGGRPGGGPPWPFPRPSPRPIQGPSQHHPPVRRGEGSAGGGAGHCGHRPPHLPTIWPKTSPGGSLPGDILHFYDAAAPLVTFESIDMDSAWFASRYDKGTADYINCPLTQEEYLAFWRELCAAKEAPVHGFEDKNVFEGCMPVEVMARRGEDTLRYGPLKPRGPAGTPSTGQEPYAVVQLRRDNAAGHHLSTWWASRPTCSWPEQKRVFSMIPALQRCGVPPLRRDAPQHLSLDSPRLLDRYYRVKAGAPHRLCRPDDRGGGVCGVHRLRLCLAALELARRLEGTAPDRLSHGRPPSAPWPCTSATRRWPTSSP